MDWEINVDAELLRQQVHELYGGQQQGGISTPANSSNIMLFSSNKGRKFGYNYDGFADDGTYHYTGEGRKGDQKFVRGNLAILNHEKNKKTLRLFKEVRPKTVRYLGQYKLASDIPYYIADSPDEEGVLRSVIVFRLHPNKADTPSSDKPQLQEDPHVIEVDPERNKLDKYAIYKPSLATEAKRREASLVHRYIKWLRVMGHEVKSKKIFLPGQRYPLTVDLFDTTIDELIEAKGSAARDSVRLALGQILDYDRYVKSSNKAILLPTRPAEDLIDLLCAHHVNCIYEVEDSHFERITQQERQSRAHPSS